MRTTKFYLQRYGRPVTFYVDRDSIYKINRQATMEEQLRDEQPITQFKRAMNELNIEVILALTPQAKGRVERSFKTHQDRLVKELRLAGILSIEDANKFLGTIYIPDHNTRCAIHPANPTNAHSPLLKTQCLEEILSLRSERTIFNDFTVRFQNKFFQILPNQPVRVRPKDKVMVEIRLNGSIHLRYKDYYLNIKVLPHRPYTPFYATSKELAAISKPRRPYKPPLNHPWRKLMFVKGTSILPPATPVYV